MKPALLVVSAAAFVLATLVPGAAATRASDISAATRNQKANAVPHKGKAKASTRSHSRQAQPRRAQAPRTTGRSSFGWRPADPSFDQQGRRYQPPPGLSCPIDLGYGLWGSCQNSR